MTVYLVTTGFSANTIERAALLEAACQQRGVACVVLESTTADRLALPALEPGDALYNATRGGVRLEETLWRPRVATFYTGDQPPRGIQDTTRWLAAHTLAGLPQPRTIIHPTADRALLARYVVYLGGFPLVLKVAGGTLGTGVMQVDSWPALFSLTDYLVATGADFILRQYIAARSCLRLMVIGAQVIVATEDDNPPKDFRSNSILLSQRSRRRIKSTRKSEALAVAAVQAAGVEFGGVDIVLDATDQPYLLGMNFPCGISAFDEYGVDVPGMMVAYLAAKAAQL